MNPADFLNKYFQFKIGGINFSPTYWQAGAVVILLFLLVVTLAQVRRHFMDYSVRGGAVGVVLGFLLALVIEGFLLVGGKSILINVFGWKNPPKPLSNALDAGKNQLITVLGAQSQPTPENKDQATTSQVVFQYQGLSTAQAKEARSIICSP